MSKENQVAYIKIGNHCFYRIRNGEAHAVNTERNSFKRLVSLPSAYMKEVSIITEIEFNNAYNQVIQ
jgi:hypothetical protein